ncbi:MAG TPA: hypothetical protein VK046_12235, partial [Actinomycetaceae bacterium]|nr:hypothetical protein [Actinomycetaceae bacterium]
ADEKKWGDSMSHDASRFYGIDTTYARDSSRQMDANAQDLGAMVGNVSAMLDSVVWVGPAAKRFKQDWDGALRPELEAACHSLSENARELHRRADMQDEVSR